MENFCHLNKLVYPCNAQQNNNFIIQLCVVVELFSLEDGCGFVVENASFYVTVEFGGSVACAW